MKNFCKSDAPERAEKNIECVEKNIEAGASSAVFSAAEVKNAESRRALLAAREARERALEDHRRQVLADREARAQAREARAQALEAHRQRVLAAREARRIVAEEHRQRAAAAREARQAARAAMVAAAEERRQLRAARRAAKEAILSAKRRASEQTRPVTIEPALSSWIVRRSGYPIEVFTSWESLCTRLSALLRHLAPEQPNP